MRRLGYLCFAVLLLGACSSSKDESASTTTAVPRSATTDVTQPIEQMQMKASRATDLLIAHKWNDVVADFNGQMSAGLSADGLKTAWAQVETKFGAYKLRGTTTRVRPGDSYLVFDTPLTFASQPAKSRISYDADGKIAGLYILKADVP